MDAGLLTIASTVFSAVGALSNASAQRDASNYNAAINARNATIAQQQGAAAQAAQDKQARLQIGQMIANYGASGVDGGQGSPLDVLQDSVRTAKLDNLTIGYNYALRSQGFSNAAALDNMRASNASTSGLLGAAGAVASGYGKYNAMRPPGNKIPGVSDAAPYDAETVDW